MVVIQSIVADRSSL